MYDKNDQDLPDPIVFPEVQSMYDFGNPDEISKVIDLKKASTFCKIVKKESI